MRGRRWPASALVNMLEKTDLFTRLHIVIALFFSAPAGLKAEVASIYRKVFNSLFFIFFQLSEWKKKGVISILIIKFSLE